MASPESPQQQRVLTPNKHPQPRPQQRPPHLRAADIRRTKEYKAASRRWTSAIVALPILMYTSYVLFDRTYGNKRTDRAKSSPIHKE